ncbi:MAG: hypothetical protein FJX42_11250 [Alphaproteobacteria bacterium]|nr:hypothetical protein [Alphaproteobacteria bacterium]
MKARTFLMAAAAMLISAPVFASSCPKHMKAIDDELAKNPAKATAEVKKLRADGESLHKAGKHDESMKALGAAEKLLGIGKM